MSTPMETQKTGSGFGDVVAQLLQKPVAASKDPILSLNRKRDSQGVDVKQKRQRRNRRDTKLLRRQGHVVPDAATGAELEKKLIKIATRGVVTLFNAVSKQQKKMKQQSEAEESKDAKKTQLKNMSKSCFLDMLKQSSQSSTTQKSEQQNSTKAESAASSWKVLNDDALTGAASDDDWSNASSDEGEAEKEEESA